ncbi:hypothetical protein SFUMM280S_00107 [Streptomyces fumanus]
MRAVDCGVRTRLTPPTRAVSDSPERRLSQAMWTATREEDWPVSTVRLGPWAPRKYETRLAMMLRWTPVVLWAVRASGPSACRSSE